MEEDHLGIVYGVQGLPYFTELVLSVSSVKQHIPSAEISLCIDEVTHQQVIDHFPQLVSLFDFIRVVPNSEIVHKRSLKFFALSECPFAKALFMDVDTLVLGEFSELFPLLDKYEVVLAQENQKALARYQDNPVFQYFPPVPISFPERNSGVILFRNSTSFKEMVNQWRVWYDGGFEKYEHGWDQSSLRSVLYHSDIKLGTLIPEYNCRVMTNQILRGEVKIVHGHGDLVYAGEVLNQNPNRIRPWLSKNNFSYYPESSGVKGETSNLEVDLERLGKSIKRIKRLYPEIAI